VIAKIARRLEQRWRRQVEILPVASEPWRYSRPPRGEPAQGWKIHLSATPLSANEVFARVRGALFKRDLLFKVPARLDSLVQLNAGIPAFSQVGKFMTVYPRSSDEAMDLARELHARTRDLRGPQIPFDIRYRRNSLVHYRYGSFARSRRDSQWSGIIFDFAGKQHRDQRSRAIPPWLADPFQKGKAASRKPHSSGPIGCDYLPFRVIVQRGKGGVYEAVDLSVSPARFVIIKEGRRHGESGWDGCDGYARIRWEAQVLRALQAKGLPVPRVFGEFNQDGNRYLVLEKLAGRPLLFRGRAHPGAIPWRGAQKIIAQLGSLFSILHAAGWVWRDCKPSHILMYKGEMRLIDFEGACQISETNLPPWGSPGYTPPIYDRTSSRRAGVIEDQYALGAIGFYLATGALRPMKPNARARLYRRAQCPDSFRDQVEALLDYGC
jgi:hypothetical protein